MKRTWLTLLLVLTLTVFLAVPAAAQETVGQATVSGVDGQFALEEAIEKAEGNNYVTLLDDAENVTVDKNLFLDLNGYTITNLSVKDGCTLSLFDSATADYESETGYGKITGTVTGEISRTTNTPKATYRYNYRYLTIKDEEGYHAHRIYITVKSVILYPADPAINYRTVLRCDSVVAKYLNTDDGAYGVKVRAYDTDKGAYTSDEPEYCAYKDAVAKWDGTNDNSRVTALTDILRTDMADEVKVLRAETVRWDACGYILVDDQFGGDEVVSSEIKRTLKAVVEEAEAKDPATLSAVQKSALSNMYSNYSALMSDWGLTRISGYTSKYTFACLCGNSASTNNPCAETGHRSIAWQNWTDSNSFPTEAGNYILQTLLIPDARPEISEFICINLNGNGWSGYAPLVKDGGVLNVVNTDAAAEIVAINSPLTVNAGGNVSLYDNITLKNDSSYAPGTALVNNYGELNVYGGNITCTKRAVYLSADSYMFVNKGTVTGGDIGTDASGGTVVSEGGELYIQGAARIVGGKAKNGGAIWSKGIVHIGGNAEVSGGTASNMGGNLYVAGGGNVTISGGTVSGGNASSNAGGNVYIASNGTLNVVGGYILNGAAYAHGGNVYVPAGGKLNVTGGTISGGYRSNSATPNYNTIFANVYVLGEAKVSGGTVSGLSVAGGTLTLSGNPTIDGSRGLMYSGTPTITIDDSKGDFAGTVSVWPTAAGYITGENDKDYSACFNSLNPDIPNTLYANKKVYIGTETKAMCACGGKAVGVGDHQCKDLLWTAWDKSDSLPTTTGNYYLTSETGVTLSKSVEYNTAAEVNIDLNGKTVTLASTDGDARIFKIQGGTSGYKVTVGLTDSVGGGSVIRTHTGAETIKYGSVVWLADTNHTFNLYAGVLDGSAVISSNGGAVIKLTNGKFNMYGGEIKGGKDNNTNESSTIRGGGAVAIESAGTFNMIGGTVSGGNSVSMGGNLVVRGKLNVSGGTVTGGYANFGGNIYAIGSVNVSGGAVEEGAVPNSGSGGNIYVKTGGTLAVSGGTVSGGHRVNGEDKNYTTIYGNIFCYGGTATLSGGTVNGIVTNPQNITLSGTAVVGTPGLARREGAAIILDEQNGEFSGHVLIADAGFVVDDPDRKYADNFGSAVADKFVCYSDGKLNIGTEGTILMCVCGGKAKNVGDHVCKSVEWQPWTQDTKLPTDTGNYYLTKNVTLSEENWYQTAVNVNIDMNGKNITMNATANSHRVFTARDSENTDFAVTIGLTNSKTTGGIVKSTSTVNTGYGMLVWLNKAGHTFNLYDGILDASALTGVSGGVAVKLGGGTFNMYGGQIKGGYEKNENASSVNRGGGSVTIESDGTFNLYNGTISGGRTVSNGGNFMVKGTLNVKGGTISNGRADNVGGNIITYAGSTLNVSGGSLYGGHVGEAKNYADKLANVYAYGGNVNLSGGTVSGLAFYKADDQTEVPVLTLSGKAVINSYEVGEQKSVGLYLSSNAKNAAYVTVAEGFSGSVAVSVADRFTNETTANYTDNFVSLLDGLTPVYDETDKCIHNLGDFRVGYNAQNITPTMEVKLWGYGDSNARTYTPSTNEVKGDLLMTCVAMTDEVNNTVLMYTMDLGHAERSTTGVMRAAVSEATGVPYKNIMFTATHTHSAPYADSNEGENNPTDQAYITQLTNAAVAAAEAAMADRTKAEMFFGSGNTSGINFVRQYINQYGDYVSDNHGTRDKVTFQGHVTDTDTEMRLVKFERQGKTPVVLANWQCHPTLTGGYDAYNISADFVGAFRDAMGADYLVAFYQGGAGNINPTSRIDGEMAIADKSYTQHGRMLAQSAKTVLGAMTKVETGRIRVQSQTLSAEILTDSEDVRTNAQKVIDTYDADASAHKVTNAESEGAKLKPRIWSIHHAWAVRARQRLLELEMMTSLNLELNTLTIGNDFAWSTMPGEVFDATAKAVREDDGYTYSFATGYTNGYTSYFPTEEIWNVGAYEVDVTKVVRGTAEKMAETLLNMLKKGA